MFVTIPEGIFSPVYSWSFHPSKAIIACCSGSDFILNEGASFFDGRMHKARHFNSYILHGKFSCHV